MSSLQVNAHQTIRLNTNVGLISSILFAGLTGLGALLVIPLPFTPVPITGQTFVVLLSGFVLGRKYGPLSQLLYVLLGVLGIPWFANQSSGLEVLLGATGGYLLGFVITSFIVGYVVDISENTRSPLVLLLLSAIGTVTVYISGILGLMLVADLSLWDCLLLGFFPFIPGDVLKLVIVFSVVYFVVPSDKSDADLGIDKRKRLVIYTLSLAVAVTTVSLFIAYLLGSGTTPPVNLALFSVLTTLVVIPTLVLLIRPQILKTSKD